MMREQKEPMQWEYKYYYFYEYLEMKQYSKEMPKRLEQVMRDMRNYLQNCMHENLIKKTEKEKRD